MKLNIDEKRFLAALDLEGDHEIGAGCGLRAALDILQAAMTAKKPIPLAFKKAIIDARAALEGK